MGVSMLVELSAGFVVAHESAVVHEPAQGAFDDTEAFDLGSLVTISTSIPRVAPCSMTRF